jgi:translation elongation factor EF-Tu-like GTPase
MSRPPSTAHARVIFELTATKMDGSVKHVLSGYRPTYEVRSDYWTSVHHQFETDEGVVTGGRARADVWFISPEAYPHSLWAGRVLNVAEGSRIVGTATIEQVLNPLLAKNAD